MKGCKKEANQPKQPKQSGDTKREFARMLARLMRRK